MTLADEIKHNFAAFQEGWRADLSTRLTDLPNHLSRFERSYMRLTSFQAWRVGVIDAYLPAGSVGFYAEAQNDALISHVQASVGLWRVALKSLRSCIENTLLCLYYKDHQVEQKLWEIGKFRISVSAVMNYFKDHPLILDLPESITGIGIISQEYGKLSKAVHASSRDFRMTEDGKGMSLWKTDTVHENRWETHEKRTVLGLNLLMLALFKEHLQGANLSSVRQSLGLVIPKGKDAEIKSKLAVTVRR